MYCSVSYKEIMFSIKFEEVFNRHSLLLNWITYEFLISYLILGLIGVFKFINNELWFLLVFHTRFLLFFNNVLFLCMMFLAIFVLMRSWCIVWLLIVFNQTYSYDVLYILSQCALRIEESEISYVYVHINVHVDRLC
jgi:hypothetical protein